MWYLKLISIRSLCLYRNLTLFSHMFVFVSVNVFRIHNFKKKTCTATNTHILLHSSVCVCVCMFFYLSGDLTLKAHRLMGTRVTVDLD